MLEIMKYNHILKFTLVILRTLFSYSYFGTGARESHSSRVEHAEGPVQLDNHVGSMFPKIAPLGAPQGPQPFLPLLAPSPMTPFTNISIPKLSGHFLNNFSGHFGFSTAISVSHCLCRCIFQDSALWTSLMLKVC